MLCYRKNWKKIAGLLPELAEICHNSKSRRIRDASGTHPDASRRIPTHPGRIRTHPESVPVPPSHLHLAKPDPPLAPAAARHGLSKPAAQPRDLERPESPPSRREDSGDRCHHAAHNLGPAASSELSDALLRRAENTVGANTLLSWFTLDFLRIVIRAINGC